MALSEGHLISKISAHFEVSDLCNLEAASKDFSGHLAWLTTASNAGLLIAEADRSSIKALLFAVRGADLLLRPQTIIGHSSKGVQALAKAALQMRKMETEHLSSGGLLSKTFTTHFQFTPEVTQSYLANQHSMLSSIPVPIDLGNGVVIRMALIWYKGTVSLSLHATPEDEFQPVTVQLRSVSSPLVIRKVFKVRRSEDTLEGCGLGCMTQTATAFAENMKVGILCVGLVHDFDPIIVHECDARYTCSKSGNALALDIPGWTVREGFGLLQ